MDNGAKVSDYLFIGSLPTAMSATWLRLNKIDFILNMSGIKYATDVPTISIDFIDANVSIDKIDEYTAKFMLGKDIITKCVGDKKNILVHCAAGINRSAATIGFYLLDLGYNYDHSRSFSASTAQCGPRCASVG